MRPFKTDEIVVLEEEGALNRMCDMKVGEVFVVNTFEECGHSRNNRGDCIKTMRNKCPGWIKVQGVNYSFCSVRFRRLHG